MVSVAAPIHRLSVDDVLRMVAAGVLDEDDRVELVDGVLVDMQPIGPEHSDAVEWLTRHFVRGTDLRVRVQDMLLVEGGYRLPDLIVFDRSARGQLLDTALLVVEVAQTSQERDEEKAADYARAGVPEYWIVDVVARAVIAFRDPGRDGYGRRERFADGTAVTPLIPAPPVPVSDLFGPRA